VSYVISFFAGISCIFLLLCFMAGIGIIIQYSLDENSLKKNSSLCAFIFVLTVVSFVFVSAFVAHHIFYPAPTPEIVVVPIIVPSACGQ
jgi:hypothetical protein